MYHKNNPWISLVALLLMVLIIVLNCTGCAAEAAAAETKTAERFTVENAGSGCRIITDNETGNQYLFYRELFNLQSASGGLCKLEG